MGPRPPRTHRPLSGLTPAATLPDEMRTLARLLAALLVAGLLGMAPGAASPASAAVDTRSTAKVVVIVGAVHGSTPSYRQRGQENSKNGTHC